MKCSAAGARASKANDSVLIDVTLRYYFYCNQTNNQTSGITLYHEDFAIFLFELYVFIYKKQQHTHSIKPWEEITIFQELYCLAVFKIKKNKKKLDMS